jgi:hypothetical protein
MNAPTSGDRSPAEEPGETPGRAANPNAESEAGLAGDLGVSSERTGPFDPGTIEGTGTVGTARGSTDGEVETHPGEVVPSTEVHRQVQDVEENTATLPPHEHIRQTHPHPHSDPDEI